MNKEITKTQKLIEKFINLHRNNAKYYHDQHFFMKGLFGFSELKPLNRKYITEYNNTFKEVKTKIIRNLKKLEKVELNKISPFIYYYQEGSALYPLSLSSYLNILDDEKINNVIEYWKILKRDDTLSLLNWDNLEDFCNNHILADTLNLMNVKDVKLGDYDNSYVYEGEEKIFKKIEKFWEDGHYYQVIDEIDTLFGLFLEYFSKAYLNKELIFKDNRKKPEQMEEIFKELVNRCKVPAIRDNLNEIAKHFKFMRDKLKPKVPYERDKENWKTSKELSEIEIKLYARMSIDLAKSLHNIFVILQKEKS